MRNPLTIIGIGAAIIGGTYFLLGLARDVSRDYKIRANTWHTVKSGKFDHARFDVKHVEKRDTEYGYGHHYRSDIRVRYRTAKKDITVIIFDDGAGIILEGQVETPFAKGTQISVKENGLGERILVQA